MRNVKKSQVDEHTANDDTRYAPSTSIDYLPLNKKSEGADPIIFDQKSYNFTIYNNPDISKRVLFWCHKSKWGFLGV